MNQTKLPNQRKTRLKKILFSDDATTNVKRSEVKTPKNGRRLLLNNLRGVMQAT